MPTNTTSGPLTDEEYKALLVERGGETLMEHTYTWAFDGEIDTSRMYEYGKDFDIGDIVQFTDDFGNEVKVRIVEMIMSVDAEGFKKYPTFSVIIEKNEENEEGEESS